MRNSLYLRLRPFLRRDLRARLISALLTIFVLTGLGWLGVSALGKIDSREAHVLRVELGLEHPWAVCGGPNQPSCTYDDREQAIVDRRFAHETRLRLAILDELERRIALAADRLDEAEVLAESIHADPRTGVLQGDNVRLEQALRAAAVDLRPAPVPGAETRTQRLTWPLELQGDCDRLDFDGIGWIGCRGGHVAEVRRHLLEQISLERDMLRTLSHRIDRLQARERLATPSDRTRRDALIEDLTQTGLAELRDPIERLQVAMWLAGTRELPYGDTHEALTSIGQLGPHASPADVSATLATLARDHVRDVAALVEHPDHPHWVGAWTDPIEALSPVIEPSVRYRSPVEPAERWGLVGTVLFLLSSVMLVVVGPVVTATTTAREREAGTLPVLRMTGLSAGDLALAMTIGPNVFALVAGLGLLAVSLPILALTVGLGHVLVPIAIVLALAAATHLTAIGLGDALGQRVNALIVGAIAALCILGPGLVGAVMVVGDLAATGFLLGPLPAVLASALSLSGLPFATHAAQGGSSELGTTILGYALAVQGVLGILCLSSWRRRVEQAWAPLFRPLEGATLALASVGCSALAVLDLSERINVQTYDAVNLITFLATGFLMPILGWLLVSSLVRPARAASVASVEEVRRAFGRFQLFVVLTFGALAAAYAVVLEKSGLGREESEIMWATISQGILVAETAVATLLWASRKRENRHRILILGSTVVLLQALLCIGVYNLEVEYVALTQASGLPLLVGMEASPYWLAFLVVLWAAGLGLILAALLRERDRARQGEVQTDIDELDDEEDGDEPSRWLH